MKLHKFMLTPPIVAISAALLCGAVFGATVTFTGGEDGKGTAWAEDDNWDTGLQPSAGDDVVIDGKTVVAQGDLVVNSLELKGAAKLTVKANEIPETEYDKVFKDEATTLDALRKAACIVQIARDFTVGDTAIVYPESPILTGVPVVFKVGGDFTLGEGAKFYTRRLGWGWSSGLWKDKPSDYCKPRRVGSAIPAEKGWTFAIGAGMNYSNGGQYGSTATGTSWQGKTFAKAYGPSFAPLFSGSPGGSYNGPDNGRGSGSIVVLAKGDAKIDGILDANGSKMADKDTCDYSGASGGGIWLAAATFTFGANALLTAEGGDCSGENASAYGSGGGGRIALAECCTDEEIDELYAGRLPKTLLASPDITAVQTSVIGGLKPKNGGRSTSTGSLSYVHPATMPVKMTVEIFGEGTVTYDGATYDKSFEVKVPASTDLQLTATPAEGSEFAAWCGEALPVQVVRKSALEINTPDPIVVTVSFRPVGDGVCVWTGGGNPSKWYDPENWEPVGTPAAGDDVYLTNVTLTVKDGWASRSLTIAESSKVTFQAVEAEGESTDANLYAHPTVVGVSGKLTIDGTSVITVANDLKSGAAVRFDCGSFYLGASASITATKTGWGWYSGTDDPYKRATEASMQTRAMGPGQDYRKGPGHGAKGGSSSGVLGAAYGYKYAPFLPGSPNGLQGGSGSATRGGGTIWIKCGGLCELYGTLTADGVNGSFCPTSGGGIWICAMGLKSLSTTSASAIGGNITMESNLYGSFAAGGRVSLTLGATDEQLDALATGTDPAELGMTAQDAIDLFPVSVKGGIRTKDGALPPVSTDGTVTTVTGPLAFVNVVVNGSPVKALGVDPEYGSAAYEGGSVQTFTAPEYGVDPANGLVRYKCDGYVVSNATEQVKEGAECSVDVTIANVPMSVTWKWGAAEHAIAVRKPEHGTLTLDGVVQSGDAVQWVQGTMASVGVVPDDGYEFVCWRGNVPFGFAAANPLAFAAGEPVDVTPVLREASGATMRVWTDATGSGDCYEPANWDPAGVPGVADAVKITNGTCKVENCFHVAALSISGGTLKVGATGNVCAELVVTGDMIVTNGTVALGRTKTQAKRASLSVGGDLTLANEATLKVYGAPITATDTFATGTSDITVGGALALEGGALLYLESDYLTGGSVKVTATAFALAEGATVSADEAGFMWLDASTPPQTVGVGANYDIGGAHGHASWGENVKYGHAYGFRNSPVMPGSPSGMWNGSASRGGGLIRIHAKTMSVFGTLTANARMDSSTGGASGGGIWLTADRFAFGRSAKLLVRGGPTGSDDHHYGSSVGAGGRIAIGYALTDEQIAALAETGTWEGLRPKSRRLKTLEQFRSRIGNADMVVDMTAELRYDDQKSPTGTFCFIDMPDGLMLLVK